MEEVASALFGELPSVGTINSNYPSTKLSSSSSSSSIVIQTTSSSSSSSVTNNTMNNNNSSFHVHQQSILADTLKHISSFSCGQELQKDVHVKEKLNQVISTLYNAIIGDDDFLRKFDLNKPKNKFKSDDDKTANGFKYLSLKDARNIASTIIGCDVNKWNREEERRLCFELSLIKLYSHHPECKQLFIHSYDELLQSYPEFEPVQYEADEMEKLLLFRNYMKVACCTMQAHNNKGHLLDLVTRLCEGSPEIIKYITGSGEKPTTRRRVLIYEREGEVSKISRPERANSLRKEDKHFKTQKSKKGAIHSNRFNTKPNSDYPINGYKRSLSLKDPSKFSPSTNGAIDDDSPRSGFEILVDIVAQESMVLIDSIAKEQSENPPTPSINDINPPDFKHTFGCSGEMFGQNLPPPSLLRLTSLGIIEKDFQSQENLTKLVPEESIDKGLPLGESTIPFSSGYSYNNNFSPRNSAFTTVNHPTGLEITLEITP